MATVLTGGGEPEAVFDAPMHDPYAVASQEDTSELAAFERRVLGEDTLLDPPEDDGDASTVPGDVATEQRDPDMDELCDTLPAGTGVSAGIAAPRASAEGVLAPVESSANAEGAMPLAESSASAEGAVPPVESSASAEGAIPPAEPSASAAGAVPLADNQRPADGGLSASEDEWSRDDAYLTLAFAQRLGVDTGTPSDERSARLSEYATMVDALTNAADKKNLKSLEDLLISKHADSSLAQFAVTESDESKSLKEFKQWLDSDCPAKCTIGRRFSRLHQKSEEYNVKNTDEKRIFREKWGLKKYDALKEGRRWCQAWARVDITQGTYMSAERVAEKEGNYAAAMKHCSKAIAMGGPWISYNDMTERIDYLWLKRTFREEMSKCWSHFREYVLNAVDSSDGVPRTPVTPAKQTTEQALCKFMYVDIVCRYRKIDM